MWQQLAEKAKNAKNLVVQTSHNMIYFTSNNKEGEENGR